MQNAADGKSFVIVQRMFENGHAGGAGIHHQVFPDEAAGIGQTIRELLVRGKQQQPRSLRAIGANNHGLGFLQMDGSLLVEVRRAGNAAVRAGLDAVDVAVGADFAAPGFFRHSNDGRQRAGLGADFAAKAFAEAALHASAAPRSRLRKNRHRRGERMPAELARRAFENDAARFHRQRRHRIRLRTRRIERAGAGETGNADFPFHFRVIRLEVGVSDRPVGERGARNRSNFAALDKINFMEAPVVRGEMDAGPADHPAVDVRAMSLGFVLRRLAESSGLKLRMIGELVPVHYFDFVVGEIRFRQVRSLLENHHAKAVRRKLLGKHTAGRAGSNNDEIHFIRCLVLGLIHSHVRVVSFAKDHHYIIEAACNCGVRRARE